MWVLHCTFMVNSGYTVIKSHDELTECYYRNNILTYDKQTVKDSHIK